MATERPAPPDELKSAQVNVKLTPSEKADVVLVSAFDSTNEGETIREYTLSDIRGRAARIRAWAADSAA